MSEPEIGDVVRWIPKGTMGREGEVMALHRDPDGSLWAWVEDAQGVEHLVYAGDLVVLRGAA